MSNSHAHTLMFLAQHAKWDVVFVTLHDGEQHKFSLLKCGVATKFTSRFGNRKLTHKCYFMSIECYKRFYKLLLKILHGFCQMQYPPCV